VTNRFYGRNKAKVAAIFCGVVIIFGILTGVRGRVWENDITLWSDTESKYPNDARVYYNLGSGYFRAGNYEEMFKKYEKGLKLNPKYSLIYYSMGVLYAWREDYDSAETLFKKALKNAEKGDGVYQKTLNNLGGIYFNIGRYEKAKSVFKELDLLLPRTGLVHFNIGQVLKKQKKFKDAIKEFQLAIEYDYPTPEAYVGMVKCMIDLNDIAGAEKIYEKYRPSMMKFCIGNFIKGLIAEYKKDITTAKEQYDLYLLCKKNNRGDSPFEQKDPYVKHALQRLSQISK
jgi:tetratricopeptide (TPR) repeat protein